MGRLRGKYLRMLQKTFDNAKAVGTDRHNGTSFYVCNNSGADTNDGLSWETAFKTLEPAFTASTADIGSGSNRWTRRNTIYISGDRIVEDLTALPDKTDVVGVGSMDSYKHAVIEGNHTIADGSKGCRFINVGFEPAASADIFTITSSAGLEFVGCSFYSDRSGFTGVSAIDITACAEFKVLDCIFRGGFTSDFIDIGDGNVTGMIIKGNIMTGGADNGIMVTGTATADYQALIADNIIQVADITIDVNSTSLFNVIGNRCISANALGATSYVIDLTFATDNVITGNDVSATIPVGSSA